MEKPIFVDNESKPLVNHHDEDCNSDHDDDYDDYNTPDATVEETTFTKSSSIDKQ